MATQFLWTWLRWLPIRHVHQVVFAESLSQALLAGLPTDKAIRLAADVNPGRRFRGALREMSHYLRTGYDLEECLLKTGVRVRKELLAALRVGEERGCLAEQLSAYARRYAPHPEDLLASALGRRAEVTRFARALAILMKERGLTVGLVEEAGELAAGAGSSFVTVARRVAQTMTNGCPFSEALQMESKTFDLLFCRLVAAADHRDKLIAVLSRLGGESPLASAHAGR